MSLPLITRCMALLLCVPTAGMGGQPGDGFVVQERAGLVLVKPQPWSKDTEATALEFKAFVNRTADGAVGAGYYEFRTRNADRRQIPVARIVRLVVYPDLQQTPQIVSREDRQTLATVIDELRAVEARFPGSRIYLDPFVKKVGEELEKYDSGMIKTEGTWIPKQAFVRKEAEKLADLLKAEVRLAQPPSRFELDEDPRFIALKQFANTNPDAQRLASEVSGQYQRRTRAEKRSELLSRLTREDITLPEAQEALTQLKALHPEEDPKSSAGCTLWDSGIEAIDTASIEAGRISRLIESEFRGFEADAAPPRLSSRLDAEIGEANAAIARFRAGHPPRALSDALRQSVTVCSLAASLGNLKALFDEKRYIEAKDVLDELIGQPELFGANTMRVASGLRRQAVEKIGQFTRLRDEGKLLADSGKKPEALERLEAAYSLMPDRDVAQQIALLKEDILAATQKMQ
jgi:tetratricopeptide (TPR) repeat protein